VHQKVHTNQNSSPYGYPITKIVRVMCTIKLKRRYAALSLDFFPNNAPIIIIALSSAMLIRVRDSRGHLDLVLNSNIFII